MSNPYLNRLAAGGKNPHGKKSERKIAKKMGAHLHPNSGAMTGIKSDASLKLVAANFRLEMKCTDTQTMELQLAWLVKIAHEALEHNQFPAVTLSFVDPQGVPRMKQYAEWVTMPLAVFQELTGK